MLYTHIFRADISLRQGIHSFHALLMTVQVPQITDNSQLHGASLYFCTHHGALCAVYTLLCVWLQVYETVEGLG